MSPQPRQLRLSFLPVAEWIGAENQSQAARSLGLPLRRIHEYWHDGIPVTRADHVAGAAGAHPLELWGPEWSIALDLHEEFIEQRRRARRKAAPKRPEPCDDGWGPLERSWRHWRNQRQRFHYDRLDRLTDQPAKVSAAPEGIG